MMASIELQDFDRSTRRASKRYEIDEQLQYEVIRRGSVVRQGAGRTVNISSGGVLFAAPEALPIGAAIRLYIAWPTRLQNQTALQLSIGGVVVRTQAGRIAVAIQRHEFRTQRIDS